MTTKCDFYISSRGHADASDRQSLLAFLDSVGIRRIRETTQFPVDESHLQDFADHPDAIEIEGVVIRPDGGPPALELGRDLSLEQAAALWPPARLTLCRVDWPGMALLRPEIERHISTTIRGEARPFSVELWLGDLDLYRHSRRVTGLHAEEYAGPLAFGLEGSGEPADPAAFHQALDGLPSVRRIRGAMARHLGSERTVLHLI